MKITDIKVTPSLGAEHRHWSLLKIFTDEGIVGLGEWTAGGPIEQLKQMLIGRDPTNINQLHYDHLWQMQGRGAGVEIKRAHARAARRQTARPHPRVLRLPLGSALDAGRLRAALAGNSGQRAIRSGVRNQRLRIHGQRGGGRRVHRDQVRSRCAQPLEARHLRPLHQPPAVPSHRHHHRKPAPSDWPLHRLIYRLARFLQPSRRPAHLQRRGAPRPALVGGSHPLGVGQCRRLGQDLPAD